MPNTTIKLTRKTGLYFAQDLGNGIELDMVLIKGGTFTMGAPETEEGSDDNERPQHQVTVPTFFMSKYPVTQAQWKAVADLPLVETELEKEPSYFKGDNLPVEQVSWYDAVEFCARLSNHTGRKYRLPSEAEWEYACRAGTTTPFHFGETITDELANYRPNESKEEYRQQTTPVGQFPANAFGLYDMHGNVEEYCLDDWHFDYETSPINDEKAPIDGSAWIEDYEEPYYVMRGGSWDASPNCCRCASREYVQPDYIYDEFNSFGFRIVCTVEPKNTQ